MHLIFDGHLDIAMNALTYERDQRLPVAQLRQIHAKVAGDEPGTCTTSVEEMRRANVGMAVTTVIARTKPGVAPERPAKRYDIDHPTQDMAHAAAMGQLAYYRALQKQGHVRIIRTAAELAAHMTEWRRPVLHSRTPVGLIITMEGADPIVQPEEVHEWWDQGLRSLMMAHFGPSAYAHGTPGKSAPEDGPLSDKGRALLVEMAALKMPLDLTHLSDRSFYEAVDAFEGAIYSSHSNCRALVPSVRQLADVQIKLILERDGVLGVALHNGMLRAPTSGDVKRRDVGMEAVAIHIDHLCQLAGDAKHAAIGSDLDGGFGAEFSPHDLDTVADLHKLGTLLKARGFAEADIAGILGGNWDRFWGDVLPEN
jgi:membrane dipeptidase